MIMFVLTESERIAILSGCVGLLFLVTLMTICFVCPVCWFNKFVDRRKSKEGATPSCLSRGTYNFDPPPPYDMSTKAIFHGHGTRIDFGYRSNPTSNTAAGRSTVNCITGIPLPSLEDIELPNNEIQENATSLGNVTVTLKFKRIERGDKNIFSQLSITIKEAEDVPLRAYSVFPNPFFVVNVYDNQIRKRKKQLHPNPLFEWKTRVVRQTRQPVYNESFYFPMEQHKLKKMVLKIEAWDEDKWSNNTIMGEVYFNLKDVATQLLKEPFNEMDLTLKLEDSPMINGQLLVGLCYLPTAERMTVALLKANNLNIADQKLDSNDFYVQGLAIYGGKIYEQRNTAPTHSSSTLTVFNEMIMFDVPFSKIDHIVLILAVRNSAGNDSAMVENDSPRAARKDTCIGKVVIGASGRKNTLNHWNAVKKSPRRQIIQWHELR